MTFLRYFILMFTLALSSTGIALRAEDAVPCQSAAGEITEAGQKQQDWDEQRSQSPLATLQEASPTGHLSLRLQRLSKNHSNVFNRSNGKGIASITHKHLDKARHGRWLQVESTAGGISVSRDYYVIALRHIIR